jgi:hypothetical protein
LAVGVDDEVLSGGVGAMWHTAVGLGIIATISNGFVLLDISPYSQSIIKGTIIVSALALDTGLTRLARTDSFQVTLMTAPAFSPIEALYITHSRHDINACLSAGPGLAHSSLNAIVRDGKYDRRLDLLRRT